MRIPTWLALLLLAVLHTAGNVAKPLHIDDTAYYYFARQAAQHPLDPYGFRVFWWHTPDPANEVLAPAVLPYWWSLALRVDADHPWVWKLGMVPFSLLFIGSLYALFRRFARGLEMPLVWLTVLSPTFWPSLNLMLDIPALALSLCSLVLFMCACDRISFGLAAFSGLVAGLAMETKYTGCLTLPAMLLYALCLGRIRLWPLAMLVAAQVFLSWEALLAMLYRESHFLYHYREQSAWDSRAKLSLLIPLIGIVGSLAPALLVLALKGLRVHWLFLMVAGLLGLGGYALVANIEDTKDTRLNLPNVLFTDFPTDRHYLTFQEALFGAWGVGLLFVLAAGVCLLVRIWPPLPRRFDQRVTPRHSWPRWPNRRTLWIMAFLVLWLCLEIAGYVPLTRFAAVRRVMGVVVVCTLLAGCVAARTRLRYAGNSVLWCIVAYGATLGLGFTALDWRDAQAEKEGVERAAAWLEGKGGTIWFTGHWGFQYYAERQGMQPVAPRLSRLEQGDWLIVPYWIANQSMQSADDLPDLEKVAEIPIDDAIRLQTVMCYYCGYTAVENRADPRLSVRIYRVMAPCTPQYR